MTQETTGLHFMQATLSSTAWDSGTWDSGTREVRSGQFAALRHVTRMMKLNHDVTPGAERPVATPIAAADPPMGVGGVAEGAGLAHDAGNLLGALSLYSDLLSLPGVLCEEHRAYAEELRLLSDRSWAMIDRLVNHARAPRPVSDETVATVLPEVVNRCRGLLSKVAGQTVEVEFLAGAGEPVGVPVESVERILTNLVKNAAEATPWVGAITVRVEGVAEWVGDELRRRVVLTVADRGCGMSAAAVHGLLQAKGIASSGGRGLGFRVVRELAAMSGGVLSIESEVDVGTSISVEWNAMGRVCGQAADDAPHVVREGKAEWMQGKTRLMAC
jgi:hypothetical protein